MNNRKPQLTERELRALFAAPEKEKARALAALLDQGAHALPVALAIAQGEDDALANAALSYLVKAVHKPRLKAALLSLTAEGEALGALLQCAHPKRRKNAARLLGALSLQRSEAALLDALAVEATRFVRPSLILALGNCGGEAAAAALRALSPQSDAPEDEKHVREEREAIAAALSRLTPREKHVFRALDAPWTLELRTLPEYEQVLIAEGRARGIQLRQIGSGRVSLHTRDTAPLEALRTYTEALFPLILDMPFSPEAVAEAVASQRVAQRLCAMHERGGAFAYRVELRGVEHSERAPFARALAALMPEELQGDPSGYDFELRIEAAGQRCALYLKLFTMQESRFAYRQGSVPAAMHPVTAACILRAFPSHLRPGARVLDPCCGGGTLLIERALLSPCDALHGVDIAQSAIDTAKANAAAADVDARFVRQDMLKFVVRKPYDEVLANLPFGLRTGTHTNNERLYALLLERLPSMLTQGGIALLVTAEKVLLGRLIRSQSGMRLLGESRIDAGGLSPSVYLLRKA